MRKILHSCSFLLVLLLVLTVAGQEIPEIYKLVDDVSNDGRVVRFEHDVTPPVIANYVRRNDRTFSCANRDVFRESKKSCSPGSLLNPQKHAFGLLLPLRE